MGRIGVWFSSLAWRTWKLLFKLGTMSSVEVAATAVAHKRRAIVIPGVVNKLTVWFGKLLPRLLLRRMAYRLNS